MTRALIIIGREDYMKLVSEVVLSLGHLAVCVTSQQAARERLKDERYNYVVLHLDIPYEDGAPRVQNGINLIREIRTNDAAQSVIAIHDRSADAEFVVEVVRMGVSDYLPFPMRENDLIDNRILEVMKMARASLVAVKKFSDERREIIIRPESITVCGQTCWTSRGSSELREALIKLANKNGGTYARISGVDLGEGLRRPLKEFCDKATSMLAQAGMQCGRYDILSGEKGYHFQPWIDVTIQDKPVKRPFEGLPPDQAERLDEIRNKLAGENVTRDQIRKISGVSLAQLAIDINELETRGALERRGEKRNRTYFIKSEEN